MSEQEEIRTSILDAVKRWQPIVDRHQAEADLQARLQREIQEEYMPGYTAGFYPGEEEETSGRVELWD